MTPRSVISSSGSWAVLDQSCLSVWEAKHGKTNLGRNNFLGGPVPAEGPVTQKLSLQGKFLNGYSFTCLRRWYLTNSWAALKASFPFLGETQGFHLSSLVFASNSHCKHDYKQPVISMPQPDCQCALNRPLQGWLVHHHWILLHTKTQDTDKIQTSSLPEFNMNGLHPIPNSPHSHLKLHEYCLLCLYSYWNSGLLNSH
jgi:hypothetical protein